MSKITVGKSQRVVDHSYSISAARLASIIWIDDETGEYAWLISHYDPNKDPTEEKATAIPGQLTIAGKLR